MPRMAPRLLVATLFFIAVAVPGAAQPAPGPSAARAPHLAEGATEWAIGGATGVGVGRRRAADNSSYVFQALSWGRVLTGPAGPALLRGRFEWAVEVVPFFGQYRPDGTTGLGISPLVWRWNLERRGSVAPFAEVAGGGLWTRNALPAGTTRANFTAHAGLGLRLWTGPRHAIVISYRFHHISNGNRVASNPGINAHVVYFAWSLLR